MDLVDPAGTASSIGMSRMFPHPHVITWSARVVRKTLNLWASMVNGSFWSA